MVELKGKYTDAIIYTDVVEDAALSTIYSIINHPAYENIPVRIMPDCHCGIGGIVIGFTAPVSNMVAPATIGTDIGCSVSVVYYNKVVDPETYPLLEHKVKEAIPMGFDINPKRVFDMKEFIKFMNSRMTKAVAAWPEMVYHVNVSEKYITDMLKRIGMDEGIFYKSIGTLGSGNHYCEFQTVKTGEITFSVHTGSRNVGQKVFKYWDKIANKPVNKKMLSNEIAEIKERFKDNRKEIKPAIDQLTEDYKKKHPAGYLHGEDIKGYLTDLFFCQAYAAWNHEIIKRQIDKIMLSMYGAKPVKTICSVHNYIDPVSHIIRKGSISALEGETICIPMNMRDGILICEGKGNLEWNYSAPHGAGRIMSRSKAKQNISMDEYKKSMEGIYTTSVNMSTIDESPMAYKNMEDIINNIGDTCTILEILKPVINIKAGDE